MVFEAREWQTLVRPSRTQTIYSCQRTLEYQYNQDSLVNLLINAYYGNAAKYILEYYKTMNQEMIKYQDSIKLNIFGKPSRYVKAFLRPELMNYYLSLMDSAEQSVTNDSLLLTRVLRTRTAVDFAWVDIAINNDFEQMPAIIKTDSGRIINPKLIALIDKIDSYAKTDSTILVAAIKYTFDLYKESALRILNQRLRDNKLKNAKLTLLTEPSPKYPVGGAKVLNDGLFGSLDFHVNWLGFQGNDMIVVADFGKPVEFSHVEINFLKTLCHGYFAKRS